MSRIALVTGGSRGIGAAVSKALTADGYTVAATYSSNDQKAAAFTEETGIKTYKWDVSNYDACISGISKDQIGCSQISYSPSEKPKFGKSIVEVNNTDDIKNFAS